MCEHFTPAEVLPVLITEHSYMIADCTPTYADQHNPTIFACPVLLLTTYRPAHSASRAAMLYVLLSTSIQRLFRTLGRWSSSTRQRKFKKLLWSSKHDLLPRARNNLRFVHARLCDRLIGGTNPVSVQLLTREVPEKLDHHIKWRRVIRERMLPGPISF